MESIPPALDSATASSDFYGGQSDPPGPHQGPVGSTTTPTGEQSEPVRERSAPVDIPGVKKKSKSGKRDKLKGLDGFLARKRCYVCDRDGLEVDLGMVYRSGAYLSEEESIVCAGCEDAEMGDGTPYSAWKIEGLQELYACGYFRHRDEL
jgi:hypothetical protein